MNKRQKLVQQQFLNNEEAVIKRLKAVYNQSLKDITEQSKKFKAEINALQELIDAEADEATKATLKSMQQSKIYQKQYQDALKKQINSILDTMQVEEFKTVDEYLKKCYEEGFIGTMYDLQGQGIPLCMPLDQEAMVRAVQTDSKISEGLYQRLGEDVDLLKKKITAQVSRGISTGMSFQQVAQQLAAYTNIGYNNAVRIARTEGHRVQVQSTMDACYKAKDIGADVVKQWDSTMDNRTRKSHQKVDGEIRELDEPFSNGLMFPGDPSGGASEVVNCRCALLQRARWALDDEELETLKKRAEYYGLDKTKDFNDYKKKYIKASTIDNKTLTSKELRQKIKDNQKRATDIDIEQAKINQLIDKHNDTRYDDFKKLKKVEIYDKIKEIDTELEKIDPLVSRYYDRPERGTPEREVWREWKKNLDIDINELIEKQMKLNVEKSELSTKLYKWDDYEEWLQWKKDNPLEMLKSQKASLQDELKRLKSENIEYKKRIQELVIPDDWIKVANDHDSEFDLKHSNPNYEKGQEYKVNCQRCVPTYEMRRRGYDVIAKPNIKGQTDSYLSYNSHKAFEDADVHYGLAGSGKRDIERLLKEWGDGARAEVSVSWKGANVGHVFVAENVGGKIVYIDPQSGSMDVSWYFKRVKDKRTRVWRIDTLNPSELIVDCCERR